MSKAADLQLVFKLIEQSTSLAVVSDFLKSKNLPFSAGSWSDMYKLRIEPAVHESKIALSELVDLLRSVEEFGQQHIFLYRTKPAEAIALMDRQRIAKVLASLDLEDLLHQPRLFELPPQPAFVDVRWHGQAKDTDLIIKEVMTRESFEYKGTHIDGDLIQKNYQRVVDRAVNVIHLRRSGDLEIRLNSRRGSSRYLEDLTRIAHRLRPFLSVHGFASVSLLKAKSKLWSDRASLSSKIRYSDLVVTNDDDVSLRAFGNVLTVNVAGNQAAEASVDSFLASDGYCDSSNIWFVKGSPRPARDIHVVLNGEAHEFAVPANCLQADYEYVLSEIRALNA